MRLYYTCGHPYPVDSDDLIYGGHPENTLCPQCTSDREKQFRDANPSGSLITDLNLEYTVATHNQYSPRVARRIAKAHGLIEIEKTKWLVSKTTWADAAWSDPTTGCGIAFGQHKRGIGFATIEITKDRTSL